MKRRKTQPPPHPSHVSVRVDAPTLARVDALAPRYTHEWRAPTRSDLVRIAILAGLDALETDGGQGDPAGCGGAGPTA